MITGAQTRGIITLERDGANAMFGTISTQFHESPATVRGGGSASPGGAGFLAVVLYVAAANGWEPDVYIHSNLLIGTALPWLVTP